MSFYFFYFIEFNIFCKFFFFASSFIAESQVESNLSCVMRIFSKALASVLKIDNVTFVSYSSLHLTSRLPSSKSSASALRRTWTVSLQDEKNKWAPRDLTTWRSRKATQILTITFLEWRPAVTTAVTALWTAMSTSSHCQQSDRDTCNILHHRVKTIRGVNPRGIF